MGRKVLDNITLLSWEISALNRRAGRATSPPFFASESV